MCTFNFMNLPDLVRNQVMSHLHFADLNVLSTVSRELDGEVNRTTGDGRKPHIDSAIDHVARARANALYQAILTNFDVLARQGDQADMESFANFSAILQQYCLAYWRAVFQRQQNIDQINELITLMRQLIGQRRRDKSGSLVIVFLEPLIAAVKNSHPVAGPRNRNAGGTGCPGGCQTVTS